MIDGARVIGWLYVISLVLFLPLRWPANRSRHLVGLPLASGGVGGHAGVHLRRDRAFPVVVAVRIAWALLGAWTVADYFFSSRHPKKVR